LRIGSSWGADNHAGWRTTNGGRAPVAVRRPCVRAAPMPRP
jgi:hypothetical protein